MATIVDNNNTDVGSVTSDVVAPTPTTKKYIKPGKFDDMARASQDVLSNNEAFDGMRLEYQGAIGNVQTSNTFHLGSSEEAPPYALTTVFSRGNATVVAKYDSDVKLFARSIYSSNIFTNTFTFQINKEKNIYLGGDAEFSIRSTNLYFKYDTNRTFTANIFQALQKKWAVGLEYANIPSQQAEFYSAGVRWKKGKGETYSFNISNITGFGLNYSRRQNNLELATEFAVSPHPHTGALMSKTVFGARYAFHASLFKIRADTDGSIIGMYEEILGGFARLCFCAHLNYFTNDYKIGLGIQISK
ncbi:translocase of outer mitochondrial membrane [Cavenderia fasciculata]|uniref:Translocase of outer mitochondrial membrane n=1 Tax=Cavenderia fasciculata TaxID=261658 RepID=F4Q893_CACFS|nr:translocase of outer mitochondrial membrane [Cavenderia fasciculata]EGG15993.1 translocase of outer mitochondrial membrane [Cavenderia fasciculata]|eukprot:XP_004352318.1 translocase of outer mitochondrial membrane [Cavenderia fasciculata]